MKINQANFENLDVVAMLFNKYRQFYGQNDDLNSCRKFLVQRISNLESVIFCEESEEGEICGFTQLYPTFSSVSLERVWILNDLFVDENYRQKGVAAKLIQAAKAWVTDTGAKGLELSTQNENTKAQSLYEKEGFEKETEFSFYFWKRI